MACYYPLQGYRRQDGSFTFSAREGIAKLVVPCGGCVGCRLRRAGEWAVRGTHEASLYSSNCFITLTYDDKRLPARPAGVAPANVALCYSDFQFFMKRLRKRFGSGVRYIVCGEYGEKRERPHFHAILFNLDFPDKRKWYKSKQGHQVYRSAILEDLWTFGNSDIGSVTPQSIGYVARYVMKKVTGSGQGQELVYQWTDPLTGEVFDRPREFARYSLDPGIGHDWFFKYYESVYPHDFIIFNGRKVRPPRYYDKLYLRMFGQCVKHNYLIKGEVVDFDILTFSDEFDAIKATRIESADKSLDDCTPARLYVREQVALARLSNLKRTIT